jgi:MFS family permease
MDDGRRRMTRSYAFALVTFAFTVTMLGATLPTPVYPIYQQQFDLDHTMLTVIYATYAGGVIVALMLLAPLSDQIGRRRMMQVGLWLSAGSAVAFLSADEIWTLLLGRLLAGLAAGVVTGTATAALMDLAPPDHPGRASLTAAAANIGGLGLGPLLAGALAEYAPEPTRLPFLVHLLLVVPAVFGLAGMPDARPPAGGGLRLRVQRVRVPVEVMPTFAQAAAPGFAGFAVLGLFTAIAAPLLATVVHQTNHLVTGLLAFAGFAASLVGQALSGTMTQRRALFAGSAVLLAATGLLAGSLALRSLPLLVFAAVAAGIGQGASFRAGLAMVTAASPPAQRAAVASAFFTTLYIALSIPVVGVGVAAERVGWARSAMVFAGLVAVLPFAAMVGLAVGRVIARRRRRPSWIHPAAIPAEPAAPAMPGTPGTPAAPATPAAPVTAAPAAPPPARPPYAVAPVPRIYVPAPRPVADVPAGAPVPVAAVAAAPALPPTPTPLPARVDQGIGTGKRPPRWHQSLDQPRGQRERPWQRPPRPWTLPPQRNRRTG